MFAALDCKSTEQLQDAYIVMDVFTVTPEIALSQSLILEVLTERIGEDAVTSFLNELPEIA